MPVALRPPAGALLAAVVLGALAALAGCGAGDPVADPPARLVVASGEASGVYYRYGQGLAEAFGAGLPTTAVSTLATRGSVENIERLAGGTAQVAFALADTTAEAVAGTGPFAGHPVAVRALARLYTNSVHVVVPAGAPARHVADLAGLRVSVGAPGSGTEVAATRMLGVAGLGGPGALTAVHLGLQDSVDALAAGTIDAFFWSGGLPTRGVAALASTTEVRLLPTDDLLPGMLGAHGAFFVEQTIPASVYGTAGDVSTIGVPNLLLVRADMPADLARVLTAAVFAARTDLLGAHPEARYLDERSAITTTPAQLPGGRCLLPVGGAGRRPRLTCHCQGRAPAPGLDRRGQPRQDQRHRQPVRVGGLRPARRRTAPPACRRSPARARNRARSAGRVPARTAAAPPGTAPPSGRDRRRSPATGPHPWPTASPYPAAAP